MVRNAAVEAANKMRTIKVSVQPASGIINPWTFTGMFGENPSTQMAGLVSSFKYEESNYMVSEEMEEYVLASSEAAYEYPGEQALM